MAAAASSLFEDAPAEELGDAFAAVAPDVVAAETPKDGETNE